MPKSEYFGGHGDQVAANMAKEYGAKKGEQVFYATANKRGQTPDGPAKPGNKFKKLAEKK